MLASQLCRRVTQRARWNAAFSTIPPAVGNPGEAKTQAKESVRNPEQVAAWNRLKEAQQKLSIYYPTVEERQNAIKEFGQAVRAIRRTGGTIFRQKDKRPVVLQQRARNQELEKKAKESKLPWKINISVVLMRFPLLTRDLPAWEEDMKRVQEYLQDLRGQHYVSKVKGTKAQIGSLHFPSYEDIFETIPFKIAPREEAPERANDMHSFNRRYQDPLFFVVKRKGGGDHAWQFPQQEWRAKKDASVDTYKRVIDSTFPTPPPSFQAHDYLPIGHYRYEYPEKVQKERKQFGAKVFFYSARTTERWVEKIEVNPELYEDYAWIGRNDLKIYFDPNTAEYLEYLLPLDQQ